MQIRLHAAAAAALLSTCMVAQAPCFDTNLGTDLALFDDDTSAPQPLGFTFVFNGVSYTHVQVCSNGYLWLGSNQQFGGDYTPTDTELLTDQPRICPFWCDLNPGAFGSGHVYYDASSPGVARITWAGVFSFGTNHTNDVQVTLDASNTVTVTYGSNCQVGTTNTQAIIGASPGVGAIANPVSLATRPAVFTSNTWYETIVITTGTPIAYSGTKMQWSPLNPGYLVADVTCTPNSLPGPASYDLVGAGCPTRTTASLYESFDAFSGNPPDLSGLNLSFLPTGPGDYLVLPGISPTWFSGFTNNLLLADDVSVAQTLPFLFPYGGGTVSQIYVSSNGFITLGGTDPGSRCCFGDAFTMLQGPPTISGFWADIYPPGAGPGGGVFTDVDPVTGDYVITWNQVPEYFSGPMETFQIALSPSGVFTIRWQSVADGNGHTWISGFSAGGGTVDPGSTDLSVVNGAFVSSNIVVPLEIDVTNGSRPAVGTTFTVDANGIQSLPNGVFAILLISTEIPVPGGVPLDSLGLSGCTAFLNLPELVSFFNLTLGAPTTNFPVAIPANNAFLGVSLMSQAISDDLTANAFGYRVSNGLRWNIGL